MSKTSWEDTCLYQLIRAAQFFVNHIPLSWGLWFARRTGTLLYYALPKRSRIAYRNLRACFAVEKSPAEMKLIARRFFQNLCMSAVEFLRSPSLDRQYFESHVDYRGQSILEEALNQKKGILLLTAHFGNWELLNISAGIKGHPMTVLVRTQKHTRSDALLNEIRSCKGSRMVTKGMPIREVMRALHQGEIVGVLADQDSGRNGIFVPFFGRLSSVPAGIIHMAFKTHSEILPVFIRRVAHTHHQIQIRKLSVPAAYSKEEEAGLEQKALQSFSTLLEEEIRRFPDQWLWGHRRWKSTPDRFVVILSDGKKGHETQSWSLAETYREERKKKGADETHTQIRVIEIKFRSRAHSVFFRLSGCMTNGHYPGGIYFLKLFLTAESYNRLVSSYADAVISTGGGLAGVNLIFARENGARTLVAMKPPLSLNLFDLVVVPRHDRVADAKNVAVIRLTPNRVDVTALLHKAHQFKESSKLSLNHVVKVGVLIGGDTHKIPMDLVKIKRAFDELSRFMEQNPCSLLMTSSRRTPLTVGKIMKEKFQRHPRCPLLIVANESNPEGGLEGVLGLSDLLVVTGESVSMVSEAIATGKPVLVFMPHQASLKFKQRRAVQALAEEGLVRLITEDSLCLVLEELTRTLPATESSKVKQVLDQDRQIISQKLERLL